MLLPCCTCIYIYNSTNVFKLLDNLVPATKRLIPLTNDERCAIIDSMELKDYSNLGTWLPPLIEKLDMSYEQFARAVGVTRSMIYYYIKDRYRPDEQTMIRMCQVLGVPAEEGFAQYTPRKVGRPKGLK